MQHHEVADIQNTPDKRNLPVNRVGIKRLRHPLTFDGQATIGTWDMTVNLPKEVKGTHMSRFIEILNAAPIALTLDSLPQLVKTMVQKLNAESGDLSIHFPYFIQKAAPISKATGLMDYDLTLKAEVQKGKLSVSLTCVIPVTSLCPCSKEISEYGAHNQRSHVTITVLPKPSLSVPTLIEQVEKMASCELYSILKRQDEKAITEKAYDNPKFVEDMVRDVAALLESLPHIAGYHISSENFESIHNHSAYAEIDRLNLNQAATKQPDLRVMHEVEVV